MADNSSLPVASGNETFANDDIGGVKYPRPKVGWGPDGTYNDTDVASGKPFPVQLRGSDGTDRSNLLPVSVSSIAAGTNNIGDVDVLSLVPGTTATSLGKAEDAAHSSGDTGVMSLAVRNDAGTALAGTDGDYIPLSTDSSGALRVTGAGGGTQYTEDAAAASDPVGNMLMAVRRDTLSASEVSADGDNIALKATSKGKLHVAAELRSGDTVLDTGSGTGGSATLRTFVDPASQNSNGRAAAASSAPVVFANEDKTALVDDAAFTPGTSNVNMIGLQADETSTDSVDEGDAGAPRMTLDRKAIVTTQPHTQGGASVTRKLDLDEAPVAIKASRGQLYGMYIVNRTTSPMYVRFYNVASGSVTVGTTGHLVGPIEIPANATDHTAFAVNFPFGIEFDTAMSMAATTGFADNNTGAPSADSLIANVFYK